MKIILSTQAWQDYFYWQQADKPLVKKVNELVKDIPNTLFEGVEKPESLKHSLSGFGSRRLTEKHQLVYKIAHSNISIASCRFHYD